MCSGVSTSVNSPEHHGERDACNEIGAEGEPRSLMDELRSIWKYTDIDSAERNLELIREPSEQPAPEPHASCDQTTACGVND